MNIRHVAAQALLAPTLLLGASPCLAQDPPKVELTAEEQARMDALDKEILLATKEAAAITAKSNAAKAKVTAATPAAAEGVTPPTGQVSGANNMTFAMYLVSLDSLGRVAQAVCNDLAALSVTSVYATNKDVGESVAKYTAFVRGRDQLEQKLTATRTEADRLRDQVSGKAGTQIKAASLTSVAAGIDIATGLVKGVAGLAALFKSERTISASENLLTAAEVSSSLSMCARTPTDAAASKAPVVRNIDADVNELSAAVGRSGNEIKLISAAAAALDASLTTLNAEAAKLAQEREAALAAGNKARVAELDARKPANLERFTQKAAALVTAGEAYVDAFYQVDTATGLSPLIVMSQFRVVNDTAMAAAPSRRLVLTLLRSSGYTLTTKRLLLSDRVDYAGGVALRASVVGADGSAVYDRIFFRDSGWIRADFAPTGDKVARQNFAP